MCLAYVPCVCALYVSCIVCVLYEMRMSFSKILFVKHVLHMSSFRGSLVADIQIVFACTVAYIQTYTYVHT